MDITYKVDFLHGKYLPYKRFLLYIFFGTILISFPSGQAASNRGAGDATARHGGQLPHHVPHAQGVRSAPGFGREVQRTQSKVVGRGRGNRPRCEDAPRVGLTDIQLRAARQVL